MNQYGDYVVAYGHDLPAAAVTKITHQLSEEAAAVGRALGVALEHEYRTEEAWAVQYIDDDGHPVVLYVDAAEAKACATAYPVTLFIWKSKGLPDGLRHQGAPDHSAPRSLPARPDSP